MKIVMFSINPIFPNVVTGGASKHLYQVARYVGKMGHKVEILCAKPGNYGIENKKLESFTWAENVSVFPDLPFQIPFPQPYNISAADLAQIVMRISQAVNTAGRFYIHDGEFLIPDVYESVPTIVSFRDNVYPESVLGSFVSKPDAVICVSEFSAAVIQHTAGRFFPELNRRIHQVNNGIDFEIFSQTDASGLAKTLGIIPERDIVLLHPHRPEPGKGLPETIQVVERLVHQHGLDRIKVLVPEWIGEMVSPGDSDFYNRMMHLMQDLSVCEHFQFFPWMPNEQMPALYSLGEVTLCLGNIVEAFGNVAYESMACGTPSIVARVGVHRSLMPDDLIDKVHYADINDTVERILAIIHGRDFPYARILAFLQSTMDLQKQQQAYAEIITGCEKLERLTFLSDEPEENQAFVLSPWCYLDDKRVYHDFRGCFEYDQALTELVKAKKLFSKKDAIMAGVSAEKWQEWTDKTWIVPVGK